MSDRCGGSGEVFPHPTHEDSGYTQAEQCRGCVDCKAVGGKTPQEWADFLGTAIFKCLSEGVNEGWVSGLPPDAAQRLSAALDAYTEAYDDR